MRQTPDKQLSAEQSRQIADIIREEIARRRISLQSLAELAKLSLSTLEKALGVSLRKGQEPPPVAAAVNGDISPDGLGAYSRRSVEWLQRVYVTLRPSF